MTKKKAPPPTLRFGALLRKHNHAAQSRERQLRAEHEAKVASLVEDHQAVARMMKSNVTKLQEENERLKAQLHEQTGLDTFLARSAIWEEQQSKLNERVKECHTEMTELRTKIDNMQEELDTKTGELETMFERNTLLEEQLCNTTARLERMQIYADHLEERMKTGDRALRKAFFHLQVEVMESHDALLACFTKPVGQRLVVLDARDVDVLQAVRVLKDLESKTNERYFFKRDPKVQYTRDVEVQLTQSAMYIAGLEEQLAFLEDLTRDLSADNIVMSVVATETQKLLEINAVLKAKLAEVKPDALAAEVEPLCSEYDVLKEGNDHYRDQMKQHARTRKALQEQRSAYKAAEEGGEGGPAAASSLPSSSAAAATTVAMTTMEEEEEGVDRMEEEEEDKA